MEFKNIPNTAQPVYTWLWNSTITREGIDWRIDEMERMGIKAFYVLSEPDNWFPDRRATHLYPKYLSEEYLDLLFYAFEKAREKGMHTWLYNEGAFPSGAACGLVTEKYPELAYKYFSVAKIALNKGERYHAGERMIASFIGDMRISDGHIMDDDGEIQEYYWDCNGSHRLSLRVDNAERRGSEEFIKVTHERLKKRFGEHMGTEIAYMFDDESYMGGWTKDFDKIFLDRNGYDVTDFMPYLSKTYSAPSIAPITEKQYRANSDYIMLCGDLLRENYFILMRDWLRKNGMQSVGHLDNDDKSMGAYILNYGNFMQTLRSFDVPGIDVIWSQISYPQDGKCCTQSMESFPRLASSAARQIGKNVALSESFAVYGSNLPPDLMRFIINFQAVRGINIFNFMVMSYDRETPMRHQYRPNFLYDNVGMDCLSQINDYTARLSYLMQQGNAEIKTAFYYPFRSICAGGEKGREVAVKVEDLSSYLELRGVSFDFIDEELVLNGKIENGKLICEFVEYDNVFAVTGDFEKPEVLKRLSHLRSEIQPDINRSNAFLMTRKVIFDDGSEGYFLFNQGNEPLQETIELQSDKRLYEVDLFNGDVYSVPYKTCDGKICVFVSLLRGEGAFFLLSSNALTAIKKPVWEKVCAIDSVRSRISRIYKLDCEKGVTNIYPDTAWQDGLIEWDEGLSGEATYICQIPPISKGEYRVNLGQVLHYAKVYVDGKKVGESTLYPYVVALDGIKGGEELKIVVANTPANECARSDYFDKHLPKDVGPYHANMVIAEAREGAGGLFGPITIERNINA